MADSSVVATCSVDGCERNRMTTGYCTMHWRRLRKHGTTDDGRFRTCECCGKRFFRVWKAQAVFCSKECAMRDCYEQSKANGEEKSCEYCSKLFKVGTNWFSGRRCCSKSCAGKLAVFTRVVIVPCSQCSERYEKISNRGTTCPKCTKKNRHKKIVKRNARRKALRRGAIGPTHTESQWRELVSKYGGYCAYCRIKPVEHRDHVIPVSEGGTDAIDNIMPACATCNLRKGTMSLANWLKKLESN